MLERDRKRPLNSRAHVEKPWSEPLHQVKSIPSVASRDLLSAATFCQQTCEFSQQKIWCDQENFTRSYCFRRRKAASRPGSGKIHLAATLQSTTRRSGMARSEGHRILSRRIKGALSPIGVKDAANRSVSFRSFRKSLRCRISAASYPRT